MAVYLVTYDLNREHARPAIVKFIKESYAWARLSESCYAIETEHAASLTYSIFKPFLDSNDQLYVIRLLQPAEGQGPADVNQWLVANLPWTHALAA